jgi:phage-related holin
MIEKYTPIIVAGLLAYMTPIYTSLLFVGSLVMADWVTGMIKGAKIKQFNSRTMIKKFYTGSAYLVALMLVRACEMYFADESTIPLVKPLVAIIALTELQSMRENMHAITGVDVLANLFGFLQRKKDEGN